jgi:hypothetical protein
VLAAGGAMATGDGGDKGAATAAAPSDGEVAAALEDTVAAPRGAPSTGVTPVAGAAAVS